MTLAFTLLQKDYILFGTDSQHTRGNPDANYKNLESWKAEEILENTGMLAFAGSDFCEQTSYS
jgi:hypothetical protein